MPIFEYSCRSCGHRFEHLTRAGIDARCPACNATTLRKLLSTFAVGEGGTGGSASRLDPGSFDSDAVAPCGACGDPRGPGTCSTN